MVVLYPARRTGIPVRPWSAVCSCCMPATRTQIYLTEEQRRRLDAWAKREGKTLAQVIRDAVDAYVAEDPPDLEAVLRESFGSIPDLEMPSRGEWDRGYG
jgi:Mlc titration factor MtfA (ptsG expression regulator)